MPYVLQRHSHSGLKVSDPIMYFRFCEITYSHDATYVAIQFSFGSESFRPHYALYTI